MDSQMRLKRLTCKKLPRSDFRESNRSCAAIRGKGLRLILSLCCYRYWDWASDANLPEIVNQRNIDINLPTADSNELVPVTVPNPLYSYKFKDGYRRERDFSIIRMPEVISCAVIRYQNGRSLHDT